MPKLTIKKIESLIKRKQFGRHPDGNQLYLNIREPEGTASWVFRFTLNGKRPWHGFGSYDSKHSLQWAREQVLEFKALVKKGIDPRDHKRAEQESARQANNLNKNTFQKVAKSYIAENQSSWSSEVTKKQWPNTSNQNPYTYEYSAFLLKSILADLNLTNSPKILLAHSHGGLTACYILSWHDDLRQAFEAAILVGNFL